MEFKVKHAFVRSAKLSVAGVSYDVDAEGWLSVGGDSKCAPETVRFARSHPDLECKALPQPAPAKKTSAPKPARKAPAKASKAAPKKKG